MLQIDTAPQTNYYALLHVAPDAPATEIKSAYRRLSRQFHPDVQSPAVSQQLQQQLNAAWEVLQNPLARAQYDRKHAIKRAVPPYQRNRTTTDKPENSPQSESAQSSEVHFHAQPAYRSRQPDANWHANQRSHDAAEQWLYQEEQRRAQAARLREEQQRQQEEAAPAQAASDKQHAEYQRIMRERKIRMASMSQQQVRNAGQAERESRAREIAAEQAREQQRNLRRRLIIEPVR